MDTNLKKANCSFGHFEPKQRAYSSLLSAGSFNHLREILTTHTGIVNVQSLTFFFSLDIHLPSL